MGKTYEPVTGAMGDSTRCRFCNEREPQAGLTLNGIACCRPCFDAAEKAKRPKFEPKFTEAPPSAGMAIIGYNPPKRAE